MHKNQKKNVKSLKNKIFYRDLIFLFFSCSVYFVEVNLNTTTKCSINRKILFIANCLVKI